MKDLAGKVAVITGAGRGIGRGIALHCAGEGMKVVLAGIGLESLESTEADLRAMGAETLVVQADVSQLGDVEALAESCFNTFGTVDLLVNNAGVAVPSSVLGSTMDDWNWVMGVNFYGVLHGLKTFVPRLAKQKTPSHVVNVASLAGLVPGRKPYSVAKRAVVALSEAFYLDLATEAPHVGISVFCPGWVQTELDGIERSRPVRFQGNASVPTDEQRKRWRAALAGGVPTSEAARILFDGIRDGKLYIGPQAFLRQSPELASAVRGHAENVLNERNPDLPARSTK